MVIDSLLPEEVTMKEEALYNSTDDVQKSENTKQLRNICRKLMGEGLIEETEHNRLVEACRDIYQRKGSCLGLSASRHFYAR